MSVFPGIRSRIFYEVLLPSLQESPVLILDVLLELVVGGVTPVDILGPAVVANQPLGLGASKGILIWKSAC